MDVRNVPFAADFNRAGHANRIDPALIAAVAGWETRGSFATGQTSPTGDVGLMEIHLASHPDVSRAQALDPHFSIDWAGRYLAGLVHRYGVTGALRAYNTGRASSSTAGNAYVAGVKDQYKSILQRSRGAAAAGASTVGRLAGSLVYPLARAGTIVGRPYEGTHLDFGNWPSDNAVDIKTPRGTPVLAVESGTIGQTGPLDSSNPQLAGQRVHLKTADNEFYYAHLSKVSVRPGQHVNAGDVIGLSGTANGLDHLHFAQYAGSRESAGLNPRAAAAGDATGKHGSASTLGKVWSFLIGPPAGSNPLTGGIDPKTIASAIPGVDVTGWLQTNIVDRAAHGLLYGAFVLLALALALIGLLRMLGIRFGTIVEAAGPGRAFKAAAAA